MQRWCSIYSAEYRRLDSFRAWLVGKGTTAFMAENYRKALARHCDLQGITSDDLLREVNLPTGRIAGSREVFFGALHRYSVYVVEKGGAVEHAG